MVRKYSLRIREPFLDGDHWKVPLTDGHFALIDECDVQHIAVCNWYATQNGRNPHTYAKGRPIPGVRYRMHRYLMLLAGHDLTGLHVDHINGNTLDNRRSNLRLATNGQNGAASRKSRGCVPFKGVSRCGAYFRATATFNGERISSHSFTNAVDAAMAYDRMALKLFGEFAVTNQSLGLLSAN